MARKRRFSVCTSLASLATFKIPKWSTSMVLLPGGAIVRCWWTLLDRPPSDLLKTNTNQSDITSKRQLDPANQISRSNSPSQSQRFIQKPPLERLYANHHRMLHEILNCHFLDDSDVAKIVISSMFRRNKWGTGSFLVWSSQKTMKWDYEKKNGAIKLLNDLFWHQIVSLFPSDRAGCVARSRLAILQMGKYP